MSDKVSPEFKLFLSKVRQGSNTADAFEHYCQAKMVVPVRISDLRRRHDPRITLPASSARPLSDFKPYLRDPQFSDSELEAAFYRSFGEHRITFREMHEDERWSPRELYDRLDERERQTFHSLPGQPVWLAKVFSEPK